MDTRSELIKKLKAIPCSATITVVTLDMGLEYAYVSAEGCGAKFGAMGRWPLIKLGQIEEAQWRSIRSKVADGSISINDLENTSLYEFGDDVLNHYYGGMFREVYLPEMMKNLLDLPEKLTADFYCLFDLGDSGYEGHVPLFFETEQECVQAFHRDYCNDMVSWDDLSDDDLVEWSKRIENGEFPEELEFNYYCA